MAAAVGVVWDRLIVAVREPPVGLVGATDGPGPPRGTAAPGRGRRLGGLAHHRRPVPFVAELVLRLAGAVDRLRPDDAALDVRPRGDLEHGVEEDLLDDGLEGPGTGAPTHPFRAMA